MKLKCSADHEYDDEKIMDMLTRGQKKAGDRCRMLLAYDRIGGASYCQRKLREIPKPQIRTTPLTCGKCGRFLGKDGFPRATGDFDPIEIDPICGPCCRKQGEQHANL